MKDKTCVSKGCFFKINVTAWCDKFLAKVNVWCGMLLDQTIVPFFSFVEKTLTIEICFDIPDQFSFFQLVNLHPSIIFQQMLHITQVYAKETLNVIFLGRWIRCKGPISLLLCSQGLIIIRENRAAVLSPQFLKSTPPPQS